ncbi:AAA family ATPase [Hoeflea sp.]|uniref:AAA family ATPase n=1 Tax=Hoeflea sp. TaxID=1940281 RepID=UPI003A948A97
MRRQSPKSVTSFPAAMAYCHLSRVFRPFRKRGGVSFLAILVVTDAEMASFYERAAEILLAGKPSFKIRRVGDPVLVQTIKRGTAKFDRILLDSDEHRPTVWVFECLEDVPAEFRAAADVFEVLDKPDLEICRAAIFQLCGVLASDEDARFVLAQPWRRNAATFRRGRSLHRTLHLLRRPPPPVSLTPSSAATRDGPSIEDLAGYGAARDWGLQLIKDIADYRGGRLNWDDIDKGVLLSGPTGVGKTRFAEALATSACMPLIPGSPGAWQAAGHLGDYLREMRKAFDTAQKNAPAILLIDEIESFGSRTRADRDNRDYSRQVINCALECLDGAIRREGVVVIATTNFPHHLDPAFLRPGRLDRHIPIALPDALARVPIVERYMDLKLSTEEADHVVLLTEDWSGAQLEQLARDARRLARREGRVATAADVIASLPELHAMPPERLSATAVHEAGHAVVGLAVGRQIERIEIADRYSPDSDILRLGGVCFLNAAMQRRDTKFYLDEIAISLGGIAAELEVNNSYDDGSGGLPTSDLARATRLATLMEVSFGMGDTLISETCESDDDITSLRLRHPRLWKRVDSVLSEQMKRAIHLVRSNRIAFDALVERIVEKRTLSGEELEAFLEEKGFQPAQSGLTTAPAIDVADLFT